MRYGGVITSGFGLLRAVHRVKPDLIHLQTEIPEAAYAAMTCLAPPLRTLPVVRTIQSTVIWDFCRPLARWCDRRLEQAQVVGVSSGCIEAFQRLRQESGAPPPAAAPLVIYNGTDPSSASVRAAPTRSPHEPVQIVFGGRFEDQKGTDLLPDILKRVRPPARGAHLTLYGCGTHTALLRALAANPPAGWTLELRDPVPNFAGLLNRFDLVLMPSRYEGLSLVATEAALAGTPVVGTDIVGLREVFPSGYPWLARAGDASSFAATLESALDQPSRWKDIARETQTHAREKFSATSMAASYRDLYLSLLDAAR
jgi:glycosyltransferase involved in cell wall biosynthesis